MRKLYTLIITVVLATGFVFAQEKGMALKNAPRNYLEGLIHDNPGVVESTITNVMILKLYYPDKDFSKISEQLDELTINASDKMIRIKAFVAANYIKNSESFGWVENRNFDNAVKFYETYIAQTEQRKLGLESNRHLTISK